MPTPIATAFIGVGAVLTSVSAVAGAIVAGVGLLLEGAIFWNNGVGPG